MFMMASGSGHMQVGLVVLFHVVLACAIPQIEIVITVIEEVLAPDSLVRNLMEEPRIKAQFSTSDLNEIYFQYLSAAPRGFAVDSNGELRTTTWVDRDSICPNKIICKVEFDLAIQPVQHFTLVKITITIQDINDNSPVFAQPSVTHVLSESTRIGTSFILPEIADPDSPEFSVQRVYIRPATQQFELRATTKPDGTKEVRLVLKNALDREDIEEYHLEVMALDGGDPPNSGTLDISITVADANDNHPIFDQETYEVLIPENAQSGYYMLGVHASDLDTGLNSRIVYRWSPDTASTLGHVFAIDKDNGEITIRGNVDYEEAATLYLTVEARDLGADPIPAEAVVIVHIEDVNDHAPEILVHTLGGPGVQEATVLEGAATGTFVARVVVSDEDSGENGRYNCSLHEEHFVLDPLGTDFLITTRGELDRETQALYSLAINCRDFGRQPLTAITYIQVKLQDINDNSPRFSRRSYSWQITENNHPRSIMLQINATDPDSGKNAEVQYSIRGPEARFFAVDKVTGVVKTTVSLDHEIQPIHRITIVAKDKGSPQMSAMAVLTVDVIDTNDEVPEFLQDVYIFRIYENEQDEAEVGFVEAVDKDSPEFNHHTYSLQGVPGSPFRIGLSTGRISTTMSLDRELHTVYTVIAVAMDTSEPYFSSSATVSIYVKDRNDNPPRFLFPTHRNNTVTISNNIPVGYIVAKVRAQDDDGDSDGQVRYEMVQHLEQDEYFTVEPYLGIINLVSSIRHIENGTFVLTIIASDNGDVSMSTSAKLFIVVDNTMAVPLTRGDDGIMPNVIIVIIVACISGVLIVALVLAIFMICHRRRRRGDREQRHKCRMETLKVLSAKEAARSSQESSFEKKDDITDMNDDSSTLEKDKMVPPKYPGNYDYPSNHVTNTQLDLSLEKSRQWLEHIKDDTECRTSSPKKDPDTESVNSGLGSNTDSGRGPSEHGDPGSRPTVEYGFIQGYHKDVLITPSAPERGILRNSFQGPLKTFTGKPDKGRSSFHGNIRTPGRTHSYGGYQPRATPTQPTIVEYDKPNEEARIMPPPPPGTKQPIISGLVCDSRSCTPQKVQFDLRKKELRNSPSQDMPGYHDNNTRHEPIMFARCHGSLTRPTESNLGPKPPTYTSAHGYQGNNKDPNNRIPCIQPNFPQRLLYPSDSRSGNQTTSEDCGSSTSGSYHVGEGETVTHVVDGVKVTDIVV